jgi:hypothetical protein
MPEVLVVIHDSPQGSLNSKKAVCSLRMKGTNRFFIYWSGSGVFQTQSDIHYGTDVGPSVSPFGRYPRNLPISSWMASGDSVVDSLLTEPSSYPTS